MDESGADLAAAELTTPDHTVAVDALDPVAPDTDEPLVDPASPVDDESAGAPTGSTEPAAEGPVDPAAPVASEDTGTSTDQAVAAVAQGEVSADGSGQPEPDHRG